MKSIQNIINKFKVKNLSVITLPLFMIIIMLPKQANALFGDFAAKIGDATFGTAINNLTGFFKDTLIDILKNAIMPLVTNVMSYQNFFSTGVNAGWDITRNFANLFFALILLIIAIATVLNVGALSNYTAKRMLPTFIFVALFINFSKAIVGFLIDISQIVMITLYNSFGPSMADIIGNASNLAQAAAESNINNATLNIFIIVLIAILTFVLLWTAVALAVRIVTLWFVIMFSPLAFMAQLVPGLQGLTSDWSKKLQSSLVDGPTLMFLLYLAFTVMKNGMLANPSSGGNLMNNGNLINYVLVIGLLVSANTTASKASEAAPSIVKNAVGVAGTVATFGLGAYVGAGGYGTGKMFGKSKELVQGGIKNVDKGIGGATRAIQIASGGKINPNERYERAKAKGKKAIEEGKAFGGGYFGAVAQQTLGGEAGRKANFNRTQLKMAEEARLNGTLDNDPELQKALAAEEAGILENYKEEQDADTIIKDIQKAVSEGDLITARALKTHLNSLGEINKLFNENSQFKNIAEEYATEADQLAAFDEDILKIGNSKYDKSYQVRNRNIAKSKKGMEGFGAKPSTPLTAGAINDPKTSDLFQDYKNGSISENAKKFSDNLFSTRKKNLATGKFTFDGNGNSEYEFDVNAFDDFIGTRTPKELGDPNTWKSMNQSLKKIIIDGLETHFNNPALPGRPYNKATAPGQLGWAWRGLEP